MRKEKYKNIFGFLLFIIIITILFSKVTWLFRGNEEQGRTDLVGYKNQGKVDILLYGGSTLFRYYSPLDAWKQTGIVAYNYATTSAKADIVKEYIKDSRKTNDAKLYVVDIRTYPLVTDQVDDKSLRNWSDSLPVFSPVRWEGISAFLFSRNWKAADIPSFYFDIIKYHSNTSALANPSQWKFLNNANIYNVDKGFAPIVTVPLVLDTPEVVDERGELTEQQENALNDLLDYCDEESLPVLFIVCPYYISGDDWRILNTCGDIIQSRGYDYINFNNYYDEIGLDFETDFYDENHVNYMGAMKYTEYLTNYLKSNYDIPDRRGDDTYSQWAEDYNSFAVTEEGWYLEMQDVINSHLEAKKIGESLKNITDFGEWYYLIQNSNFTVIIKKNRQLSDWNNFDSFVMFSDKYGIDDFTDYYIGIWNGDNCMFITNEENSADVQIGVQGARGRDMDQCLVSTGNESQLNIAGIDYNNSDAVLQIIVYDNNYKEVIDNVNITFNENGDAILNR